DEPGCAEILLVNTCGFIEPARQESLRTLRELAKRKRRGQWLIAAGCLTQRYGEEIARQVPGLDGILGTRRWMEIVQLVRQVRGDQPYPPSPSREGVAALYATPVATPVEPPNVLRAAVQGASAYLKIADGCRRPCAFCAIPLIKGPAVSRPLPLLVEEARRLARQGVKELVLIAQDTTDYGSDLQMKDGLAQLLEAITEQAPEIPWIRVLYAYPGAVSDRLIEVMATRPQILPYLDLPLQHAHPSILRAMRRPANIDWVYRTLEKMRRQIPGLTLRTTFIVGYPGEGEAEFQTLLDFVREIRFDHVGAFTFSFERGTASEALGDPVPAEVKQERWERLMAIQQQISLEIHQSLIGKRLDVLIEGQGTARAGNGRQSARLISVGRTYRDAPEIDGLTIIEGKAPLGEIVPVRILSAMPYDLHGVIENP
ncbi:MAG: 30S ribosomal protein S12 methylthiotransferase RimO, partial [Anaerolineales bacterium]|nr:30S ribosomal protein S12 methylthiotransferase RimO [Anaerolineales bacterium]MDW8446943.1 30S ribosomal protein S12 methylthiotransferase RimO [Anaerolineales bacterium]